jgi:hypothetical protein
MSKPNVDDVTRVVPEVHKLLRNLPPQIQSAILADCLALWLAGHRAVDPTDTEGLAEFRETLLAEHIDLVRKLLVVNDQMLRKGGGGH